MAKNVRISNLEGLLEVDKLFFMLPIGDLVFRQFLSRFPFTEGKDKWLSYLGASLSFHGKQTLHHLQILRRLG